MHIELIKFYEITRTDEKQHLIGSLHIRLPEIGLHIKGITVFEKSNIGISGFPDGRHLTKALAKRSITHASFSMRRKRMKSSLIFFKLKAASLLRITLTSTPETLKPQPAPAPSKQLARVKTWMHHKKLRKPH